MAIVTLRGPLQKLAGEGPEHRVDGATVTELIQELERTHAALEGWILDERGVLRRHINVFVNGERVNQDSPVGAEDRIEILPAISGGSVEILPAITGGSVAVLPAISGGSVGPEVAAAPAAADPTRRRRRVDRP